MTHSELRATSDGTLVWGAGAIGGTVGAYLTRAAHPVTFVDIVADHVDAIQDRSRGLHISGPIDDFTITARAATPADVRGMWTRVFLAVKAHDTAAACRELAPHLAADGYVVSLQNGLCEAIIADVVGEARTVGAFVNFGADWLGPGEILYSNHGAVVVGELDGRMTPRVEELLTLLRVFESDAIATDRISSFLWGKLGYASLLFAQATGQLGIADCLARPELLPLWRDLAGEAMQVATAEGVEPRGFNGFDPAAFRPGSPLDHVRRTVADMVAFNRPNPKTHSGVWRDLAIRKRRTEVDAQIAPIVEIGRRHGIECRKLAALVRMIHDIEAGARPQCDDNLLELLRSAEQPAHAALGLTSL